MLGLLAQQLKKRIAPHLKQLIAPWLRCRFDAETAAEIKANYAEIRQRCRESGHGFPFETIERLASDVSDEERNSIYEALWEQGGFRFLAESFSDLVTDQEANDTAANFIR